MNRGQGTTEYLIILAIVIVIALVVVGVLGGFPSLAGGVSAGQSKAYWAGVQPAAVVEWSVSSSTGSLVFQNQTGSMIAITDVNWNGVNIDITDVNVSAGAKATVTSSSFVCGVGPTQTYSRMLGYTYTTTNLTGLKVHGIQPLVGTCQ